MVHHDLLEFVAWGEAASGDLVLEPGMVTVNFGD